MFDYRLIAVDTTNFSCWLKQTPWKTVGRRLTRISSALLPLQCPRVCIPSYVSRKLLRLFLPILSPWLALPSLLTAPRPPASLLPNLPNVDTRHLICEMLALQILLGYEDFSRHWRLWPPEKPLMSDKEAKNRLILEPLVVPKSKSAREAQQAGPTSRWPVPGNENTTRKKTAK